LQRGSLTQAWSYNAASDLQLRSGDFVSTGAFLVTLIGRSFSTFAMTHVVSSSFYSVFYTSSEMSLWNSFSSVLVKFPKSYGSSHVSQFLISLALVKSSLVGLFSFQSGAMTRLSPSLSSPGTGGHLLRILGYGISTCSPTIRNFRTAVEMSSWVSDSAALAKPSNSLRSVFHLMIVSIASRTTEISLSIASPSIQSWTLVDACPTSMPPVVSLSGKFFGTCDSTVAIKLASSSFSTNRWVSDSSISGKPQFVELLSRGISVSVNRAIGIVPLGYVCSNLAQNEPQISLSSQLVSYRDVLMKILFTPFAGIRERGSLILTLTGGRFVLPSASSVFIKSSN